jgi:hypothetical protein
MWERFRKLAADAGASASDRDCVAGSFHDDYSGLAL